MTGYYAYPEATSEDMKTIIITGTGVSPRTVRQNAELKVEQTLDLSVLSTILISQETAKDDIYEYLDIYFRDPHSPVTPKVALVEGDLKPFFEITIEKQNTAGEYYSRLITSIEENTIVIPYTLQTAGTLLFEDAQDLVLPYLKMGEEDQPIVDGLALFSGRKYSGVTLNPDQGLLLNILNKTIGFSARITHLYKDSPLTVRINNSKRDIEITENNIKIAQKLEVILSEFPRDHLKDAQVREEIQQFLTEKIEQDMNEVMKKLQEAKCDAIGLGRLVRAYHPKWYQKEWSEHFSTLDIEVKVDVEIVKTGILN